MKKHMFKLFLLVATIAVLAFGITQLKPEKVQAALGNQGIPVRCYAPLSSISPGITKFMTCVNSGTNLMGSSRVPSGYYFLVTDVFVTPLSGGPGTANVTFYLFDAYGTSSRASSYTFRSTDGASYGQHFTVPLYVLPYDHRLEVQAFNANNVAFDIRITGLLVTNFTYVPSIISGP